MRRRLAINAGMIGITLIILAPPGRAAVVTAWRNEAADQSGTNLMTVRMQGLRSPIDFSADFTTLLDSESGYGYQILHPAKCYVRKKLAEFQSSPCGKAADAPPPIATGRSDSVAGYSAYEYRATNNCGEQIFWVAPDYPDWKRFRDEGTTAAAKLTGVTTFDASTAGLPGMIVKSEGIGRHRL